MREKCCDQQIADKDMDLPPAHGGSRRETGRLHGGVEKELQADARGQHPAVEIARVAESVAVDPDEGEQANGNGRDQNTLNCLAGRTASADRAVRLPPNRSHGSSPISSIAPSSPQVFQPAQIN